MTSSAKNHQQQCPASIMLLENIEPYDYYETLRQQGSPVWDDQAQSWVVVDYDQVIQAVSSEKVFGNYYANPDPVIEKIKGGAQNIVFSQGEQHVETRRLFQKLLSKPAIDEYREKHMLAIIDRVVDGIIDKGRADLMSEVTAQIVPRIICAILGMTEDDEVANEQRAKRILELNNKIFAFIANNYQGDQLRDDALAASETLNGMLLPYIRARKENPGNDLISRVWLEAPIEYSDMTEEIALAMCRELYFAGSDATVHASATVLYLMLSDSELREKICADREDALAHLIEEALRLHPVVQLRHRVAMVDVEIGCKQIKKGQRVLLAFGAVNRDPSHFLCPASVDLNRTPANTHMSFGRGIRSCVGAGLARAEIKAIVTRIIERLPNLRLDPDAEPAVLSGSFFRSYHPVNVIWDT